jgi:hypothetical protein
MKEVLFISFAFGFIFGQTKKREPKPIKFEKYTAKGISLCKN